MVSNLKRLILFEIFTVKFVKTERNKLYVINKMFTMSIFISAYTSDLQLIIYSFIPIPQVLIMRVKGTII